MQKEKKRKKKKKKSLLRNICSLPSFLKQAMNSTNLHFVKPEQDDIWFSSPAVIIYLLVSATLVTEMLVVMEVARDRNHRIFTSCPRTVNMVMHGCICVQRAIIVTTATVITTVITGEGVPVGLVQMFLAMLVMSVFLRVFGRGSDA
jgi:hypothetical protein